MSKLLDEHMKDMDAMKSEFDNAMNCYAECIQTRKLLLKENQRLKEYIQDKAKTYHFTKDCEQALAVHPQGGDSDE